jgi:putative transcriptional regulator
VPLSLGLISGRVLSQEAAIKPDQIIGLRRRLDLTQAQLAQMLGVHAMTVSKWERGDAVPTPYNVQQLRLLDKGSANLNHDEFGEFLGLLAMGLAVAALAFLVMRAVADRHDA